MTLFMEHMTLFMEHMTLFLEHMTVSGTYDSVYDFMKRDIYVV